MLDKAGTMQHALTSHLICHTRSGAFNAAGANIVPYPVDYRTRSAADLYKPVASIAAGLAVSDLAAHEWLGLISYRLMGLTAEIFPTSAWPSSVIRTGHVDLFGGTLFRWYGYEDGGCTEVWDLSVSSRKFFS